MSKLFSANLEDPQMIPNDSWWKQHVASQNPAIRLCFCKGRKVAVPLTDLTPPESWGWSKHPIHKVSCAFPGDHYKSAHLTRQCNWHQISRSRTGGEDYTDRTDYVSKGSVIVNPSTKQQDLHPGPFVQFFWHCVCHNNVSHPSAMYWIGCLNLLVFCSPIVPPSSWGGQVAKGCKSGVASKYAQTTTTLVHPSLKFPWNSARFLRLVDEVSTKQKLILLSAVQQLGSSPHPTGLSQIKDE